MRHRTSGRKLNRTSQHRNMMFRNMAQALIKHEQIVTTLPKAKELSGSAEPLITLARDSSVHNQRLAFGRLRDRETVVKLFGEIGPRYSKRNGGYTRILKCGFRKGDNAPMAYIELVDRVIEDKAASTEEIKQEKSKEVKSEEVEVSKDKSTKKKESKKAEKKV